MEQTAVLIIVALVVAILSLGALAYVFIGGGAGAQGGVRDLMSSNVVPDEVEIERRNRAEEAMEIDAEQFRKRAGKVGVKSKGEDIERKLFRAGIYSSEARGRFNRIRVVIYIIAQAAFPLGLYSATRNPALGMVGAILGALIGYAAPMSWLERKIRSREEDIMYFLPIVIEQVSIGVSSALDIGPCISQIVSMASERDSHNPVTEMFVHVEKLIRSGLNLEDAFTEVGEASGMMEVKHTFLFLAQCSKHGGEVSKQLQDLADSVMTQRQVQVEGKITQLPVKATGPLAMVFAGFFALLFAGLLVRLLSAFGG